jgi:hypothetical protein
MELAALILIAFVCATATSILAFIVGRCGRKLPIDGALPRAVYSSRFSPEKDTPQPASKHPGPTWPAAD